MSRQYNAISAQNRLTREAVKGQAYPPGRYKDPSSPERMPEIRLIAGCAGVRQAVPIKSFPTLQTR